LYLKLTCSLFVLLVVAALTGQELKTEDSVRPPFAVSQSALPLAVTNPSVDVGVRSRLVAKDASFSGSLALIAIALPHGSLPGVLLAKEPEARQVADPTYPKPATVTIVSDDEDEEEEVASQDVTQETTLPSDQDSVEKASSSSSSSEEDSVFDPELMSSYTLEELDYRRICSVRDLALFLQEVSNVHRYGREACFQTQHTDRHSLRKNVARGIVQNREASARERELQEMEDGLKELERALHLRGGLTPGHVEEFLGTRTPSQLFNRHFELWNYYNAVVKRKTDLQFSLGSLDGPYTFQMPPEDVAETRITLVKKITEADTICGRVSLELLALETFMYK
jgi:hypothetical protein